MNILDQIVGKFERRLPPLRIESAIAAWTSARDGVITFRISLRTSFRKLLMRSGSDFNCCNPVLVSSATAIVLAIVLPQIFMLLSNLFRLGRRPDSDRAMLAGELGFEPRSSVLETDSLTVELTPPVKLLALASCLPEANG